MKKTKLFLKLFLPLLALGLLASGVVAKASFKHHNGFEALCGAELPGRVWWDGDTMQIRGQVYTYATYVPTYDSPFGWNISIINATVDVNTGNGTAWGTFTSMPNEFDGEWVGSFSGRLTGWLYSGRGIGHGTGELSGKHMKTVTEEIPYDPELMPPPSCLSGAIPTTLIHNEIRILTPSGD